MKRRLIFFDIDGTLLDHDKNLPRSAKQAVQALQDAGHEVAIATGRAPFMFKELREELGIDSFVSYNGQYVVYNGEVIHKNPLKKELIQSLTELASANDHPLVYMNHETMKGNRKHHPHVEESIRSLKLTNPDSYPAYDPHFYVDREIYQALLFCTADEEDTYTQGFPEFDYIRWHPYSIDVLPSQGSKARGIEVFMNKLGFSKEDVYAFGDGLNDIEMLKFVENSVAMGNAHDLVKNVAKYVTKDVGEDGLVYGLELVGLLK